jgi:hypothetical protein
MQYDAIINFNLTLKLKNILTSRKFMNDNILHAQNYL